MSSELRVVTMVVDETDFLRIWLRHWRKHLPDEKLYVICHGENAEIVEIAKSVNVIPVPRPEPYEAMEEDRWKMLSDIVSDMASPTCTVVYTDVDEILVADPKFGQSLTKLLTSGSSDVTYSVGLEVIHRQDKEPHEISLDQPILTQRQYYRLTSFHSKPCIIRTPVRWGRGGHFVNYRKIEFAIGIYTIHLRFYDMDRFLAHARRRRKDTKTPSNLAHLEHRLWRNSEEEAQKLVDSLQRRRLPLIRFLPASWLRYLMIFSLKRSPTPGGLYRYRLWSGNLMMLPKRMLDVL